MIGQYIFKNLTLENGKELYITKILFLQNKIGSLTVPFIKVGTGINTKSELENFLTNGNY